MNQVIKTYDQVNKELSLSYRIARMEDHYNERDGIKDDPHRHDFYTVILVKKAFGKHMIDFNDYPFSENQLFFVNPGQVHQVEEDQMPKGYVILFSTQFLVENNIPVSFIDDLNLFNDYGQSPPLGFDDAMLNKFSGYFEEMIKWDQSVRKLKEQAIGAILKLFLIECNNLCSLTQRHDQHIEAGNSILKHFKTLVNENFATWHSSSEYASELSITPDHLNRIVKMYVGKTAKEYIQNRISLAAKRMLYFSELSAKEIGYELGFDEPSNFSAFFKKNTGESPSQFRNS